MRSVKLKRPLSSRTPACAREASTLKDFSCLDCQNSVHLTVPALECPNGVITHKTSCSASFTPLGGFEDLTFQSITNHSKSSGLRHGIHESVKMSLANP